MSNENVNHLACAYAMILLHDEGLPIDGAKISQVIAKAKIPNIEAFYAKLYANNVNASLLASTIAQGGLFGGAAETGASTAAAAPAAAVTKAPAAKEAPKEAEKEPEGDFDMGDLFG